DMADAEDADAIFACLGAYQPVPQIEGVDGENVFWSIAAYDHIPELGQNIVIIGGGMVGVEQALWLKRLGKNPVVVARHQLRDGGNHLHLQAVRNEIKRIGLEVHEFYGTQRICSDKVVCTDPDGKTVEFPADSVVFATGMRPRTEEAMALRECAPEFYPIADCMIARDMCEAVTQAYMAAKNVGLV
ncbi:MAG: FAD-dependent oxidoreductase, partial [Coriobacteriales bacterium]